MNIFNFIQKIHNKDDIFKKSVLCFRGNTNYPLLFFSTLLKWLDKHHNIKSKKITFEQEQLAILTCLKTCFLGQTTFYWKGDLSAALIKEQKEWSSIIGTYNGPNVIGCFITEKMSFPINDNIIVVTIPDKISFEELIAFCQILFADLKKHNQLFLRKLFAKEKYISLDIASLFIHYAILIGKNDSVFFDQWLYRLMVPDTSLFVLSQNFFSRDIESFFVEWNQLKQQYPTQFWISFWSEQLCRASVYITFAQRKDYAGSKKASFRLPFSFIRSDWNKYQTIELQKAHQFLYNFDFHIKNSGTPEFLELFYSKFFLKQF